MLLEIEIFDINDDGEGVGRIDGFTYFVEGAVPGDVAEIVVTEKKKSFAKAKAIKITKPSPFRVEAPCPVFEACGGCSIQNIDYAKQLELKEGIVRNALLRIGKIEDPVVHTCVGMEDPYRFRNKSQFPLMVKTKNVAVGFYGKKSHTVVEFDDCLIHDPLDTKIAKKVAKMVKNNLEKFTKHGVRHVIVRTNNLGEKMLIFVVRGSFEDYGFLRHIRFTEEMVEKFPMITSIYLNFNNGNNSIILGRSERLIYGTKKLTDEIAGLKFEVSPLSFLQVNRVQSTRLYEKVLASADLKGNETVVDLYSGIGTISLLLAKKAARVVSIESIEDAVKDAEKNAVLNDVSNIEFHCGTTEVILPKLQEFGLKADVLVLDPPRTGSDEATLKAIVDVAPDKIVYVSCKPSTMARDVKFLCENGYTFIDATPVDQFCHSTHVEAIILMTRSGSGEKK